MPVKDITLVFDIHFSIQHTQVVYDATSKTCDILLIVLILMLQIYLCTKLCNKIMMAAP